MAHFPPFHVGDWIDPLIQHLVFTVWGNHVFGRQPRIPVDLYDEQDCWRAERYRRARVDFSAGVR